MCINLHFLSNGVYDFVDDDFLTRDTIKIENN